MSSTDTSCRLNRKTLETVVRSRLTMNQANTRCPVNAVISAWWFWCQNRLAGPGVLGLLNALVA